MNQPYNLNSIVSRVLFSSEVLGQQLFIIRVAVSIVIALLLFVIAIWIWPIMFSM